MWLGVPAVLALIGGVALAVHLDFDRPEEFLRQKGELTEVRAEPLEGDTAYRAYGVTLVSSAGYQVRGHLRVPRADGRWPAIVVIGGIQTGRMAAELIEPPRPYVILGLDYPWEGPTRLTWWQFLVRVLAVREAMLLTPSAVMLATDYLVSREDVDTAEIVLVGASFGAQLVTVAGALDQRPDAVLSIYGGGDYATLLRGNLKVKPLWLRGLLADAGAALIDPLEPVYYVADISPRRFVMINGLDDSRIPLESVAVLYEEARPPKQLVWLDEGHISSRDEALLGRVLEAAVRALAADSADVAPGTSPEAALPN